MFEYDPRKVICTCARVTCGDMADAVAAGATTVAEIRERTRATAFCGSCTERVETFLNKLLSGEAKAMELPKEPGPADAAKSSISAAVIFADFMTASTMGSSVRLWVSPLR